MTSGFEHPELPSRPLAGSAAPGSESRQRQDRGAQPLAAGLASAARDRAAMISLAVIVVIVLVAIFAPVFAAITGHGVNQQFPHHGLTPTGCRWGRPAFLLGTDDQGRDILVRIAYGARISLLVGCWPR